MQQDICFAIDKIYEANFISTQKNKEYLIKIQWVNDHVMGNRPYIYFKPDFPLINSIFSLTILQFY